MRFVAILLVLALLPAPAQSLVWRHEGEGLEVALPASMPLCAVTADGFTVPLAATPCDAVPGTARVELSVRDSTTPTGPALATAMCGAGSAMRSDLWIGFAPLYRCTRPPQGAPERHFAFGARVTANNDPRSVITLDLHCPPAQQSTCRDTAARIGRAARWFADPADIPGEPQLRLDPAGNRLYLSDAHGLIADLPAAWTVCVAPSPAPNHGFWVPLDSGRCDPATPLPKVTFTVAYNTVHDDQSIPQMRRDTCGAAPARWSDWHVAGARLMRCTHPIRQGLAEIAYFGLRRRPSDTDRIATELAIRIRCPPAHLAACTTIAKEIATRLRPWNPD